MASHTDDRSENWPSKNQKIPPTSTTDTADCRARFTRGLRQPRANAPVVGSSGGPSGSDIRHPPSDGHGQSPPPESAWVLFNQMQRREEL